MPRPHFLETHQIPIWVVITGNVRSGREFRQIFKRALQLQVSGKVDGIRFVTWKGELEQAPGLETALVNSGVSIVVLDPPQPDPKIHPLFHGYVYHQRKALYFALRSLPSNCFVLKARTDFAEERFESMVAALFENPSLRLEIDIPSPIFRTRLFSYDVRPDYFFYWDDIVFSGMRDDLICLNNFEIGCDLIQPGHFSPAESRLFAPHFLKHYPILRWFSENICGDEFARLLQQYFSKGEVEPLPALILNILASYFHILSRYVLLPNPARASQVAISLKSFFTPESELGIKTFDQPWASHKWFNQSLADRLRGPEDFADPNLAAIVKMMRRMDSEIAARGVLPLDLEMQQREFEQFAQHLGCHPLVSQAHLIPAAQTLSNSFEDSLERVKMPEKRHLSWLQAKKLGARRTFANWLLRKLV